MHAVLANGSGRCVILIDVVVLARGDSHPSPEFAFALSEIQRQVPPTALWIVGPDANGEFSKFPGGEALGHADGCDDTGSLAGLAPAGLVLMLAHPWVTIEWRAIDRLVSALTLPDGADRFDLVQACDSKNPAPMAAGGYATLRGMERFVDVHEVRSLPLAPLATDTGAGAAPVHSAALLQLTTVGNWRRSLARGPRWQAQTDARVPARPKPEPERQTERTTSTQPGLRVGRVSGAFVHDASAYFSSDRRDVLGLIALDAYRFLDVGGGEGNFLRLLKSTRSCHTALVEITASVAQAARFNGAADEVWVGDFLDFKPLMQFDCVSFLDMLEHVERPESYLAHARTMLSAKGRVLASVPNVGHWSVVADLLEGRWDLTSSGIHCVTHLRFFTLKSIEDLLNRSGYKLQQVERVLAPCRQDWLAQWSPSLGLNVDLESLNTYAYLVVAAPNGMAA